jgi:membrane-associated HD superfamily phosphohydrolase
VARGEVQAAKTALDQLPWPNTSLGASIRELEHELAREAERVDYLTRLEQDLDLRTAARSRQRAVILLGLGFAGLCFWSAYSEKPADPEQLVGVFWRILLIAFVGVAIFWRRLFSNLANRRLMAYMFATLIAIFLLRVAALYSQTSPIYIQSAEILVMGFGAFAIGVASSARLATIAALVYPASMLASAVTGSMFVAMITLGSAHALFFGAMAWLWRPATMRASLSNQRR